jgi:hypothetical protein
MLAIPFPALPKVFNGRCISSFELCACARRWFREVEEV